jgi:hypothetical protein
MKPDYTRKSLEQANPATLAKLALKLTDQGDSLQLARVIHDILADGSNQAEDAQLEVGANSPEASTDSIDHAKNVCPSRKSRNFESSRCVGSAKVGQKLSLMAQFSS